MRTDVAPSAQDFRCRTDVDDTAVSFSRFIPKSTPSPDRRNVDSVRSASTPTTAPTLGSTVVIAQRTHGFTQGDDAFPEPGPAVLRESIRTLDHDIRPKPLHRNGPAACRHIGEQAR